MGQSSVLVSPLAFLTDMVAIYIGKVARFLEIKVTVASFRSLKSLIDGIRLMESKLLEGLILIKDHVSFFLGWIVFHYYFVYYLHYLAQ